MKSKAGGAKSLALLCTPVLFLAGAPAIQRVLVKSRDSAKATEELIAWSKTGPRSSIEPLLARGADVSARDKDGEPVLHLAVSWSLGEVESLLDHKADVDAQGPSGGTALIHAAEQGKVDVVRLLLSRGANVDTEGEVPYQGQHTALSIAQANNGIASHAAAENYQKIIKMLRAAGAKE